MVESMKIGTRLALGFGLVLAMMSIAIAVGMSRLSAMDEITSTITKEDWVKVELANSALHRMRDNARRSLQLLVTTNGGELENVRKTIIENRERISQDLK